MNSTFKAVVASALISTALSTSLVFAQDNGAVVELESVTVRAQSNDILVQDGYVASQDRIGTKIDTPLTRIPQSISTVTQSQIEDQEPRTLNEAVSYTASANPNAFGFDTRYDAFTLRGFPVYYNGMFRDGLRQVNGPSAWFRTEPYGIEGVTLLKGPSSSLYGVSGPGGIVNIVTKRPTEDTFREVETVFGSHNRYQAGFDLSGPVTEDGSLLYRLTGVARDADTSLAGYSDDQLYIAPALTFKPQEGTRLTLLGEVSRSVSGGTAMYYNPAYGEVSDSYVGDSRFNDFVTEQARIGYEFEHEVNDWLTLRQNLRYSSVDADLEYSGVYSIDPAQPLARYWGHYVEGMRNFVVDNSAQFKFETGRAAHTFVAGLDYSWTNYDVHSSLSYLSLEDIRSSALPFTSEQTSHQLGLYLHDQIEVDDLTVFLTGRYDWVDTKAKDATGETTTQKDDQFSGRIGVSYETPWGLIPYASYSTSFAPNVGVVFDDVTSNVSRTARPTVASQKEIGVKYTVPDTNLLLSAALFDIDQEDGVVFDTSTGINKQRQLDMNSRGIELEANASFDNGFSLIASYTHLRVKIEEGAEGTVGKELSATPNDIFSLWGHYSFQEGALAGLGLGAGVRYVGESYGDDTNSFKNNDRTFVDASISYDFGKKFAELEGLKLQVNAKNLFDERKPTCSAGTCYRDEGRSVLGSLRYRF